MSAATLSALAAGRAIAGYALRESLRRRILGVVGALTALFLVLFALGAHFAFEDSGRVGSELSTDGSGFADYRGATLLGLAMFATLFLGAVLATFLTLGVVRGDAEVGLLQSLLVRPVSRRTILVARLAAATMIGSAYVAGVFAISIGITALFGGYTPDNPIAVTLLLVLAVIAITAISLLASVFLSGTAQGITVLMIYGSGLTAGLLGQIGDALRAETLVNISRVTSWGLPFEALYQQALYMMSADRSAISKAVLGLGPFGGAVHSGPALYPFVVAYLIAMIAFAAFAFERRDI